MLSKYHKHTPVPWIKATGSGTGTEQARIFSDRDFIDHTLIARVEQINTRRGNKLTDKDERTAAFYEAEDNASAIVYAVNHHDLLHGALTDLVSAMRGTNAADLERKRARAEIVLALLDGGLSREQANEILNGEKYAG